MLSEDGLVDVALGIGMLYTALYEGLGPVWRIRLIGVAVFVPMAIALVIGTVRRRLVYPRIGTERLPAVGAVPGLSIIFTLLFFVGLLAFIVMYRSGQAAMSGGLIWLLRGLLAAAAAVLLFLGFRSGLRRFHLHAGVILLNLVGTGLILGATLLGAISMVTIPGAVLCIVGIVAFVSFIRKYPVRS